VCVGVCAVLCIGKHGLHFPQLSRNIEACLELNEDVTRGE